jgi:hypothetical protein
MACDLRSDCPTVTAHAHRGPAVPGGMRTQADQALQHRELGKHYSAACRGELMQVLGYGVDRW